MSLISGFLNIISTAFAPDAERQLDNRDFLHWITREAKKTAGNKPFYNIAKHIPELPELVAADGPMDACWHESFRIFAIENLAGNSFDIEKLKQVLDAKQQGYQNTTNVTAYSRFVKCRHTALLCPYGELRIGWCTS